MYILCMAKINKKMRKVMKGQKFRKSLTTKPFKKKSWWLIVLLILLFVYLYSIGTNLWALIIITILVIVLLIR